MAYICSLTFDRILLIIDCINIIHHTSPNQLLLCRQFTSSSCLVFEPNLTWPEAKVVIIMKWIRLLSLFRFKQHKESTAQLLCWTLSNNLLGIKLNHLLLQSACIT